MSISFRQLGFNEPEPPALHRVADVDLIERARARDEEAFAALYRRHAGAARSLALRICGERQLAEEAVQEAFLAAWRKSGQYDGSRGNVRSWVLTIVHNRAIDMLRRGAQDRGRLSDERLAEQLESEQRTDQEARRREQARDLRRALEMLPVEQSSVIELAYYGGYSQSEIASLLSTPVGTVKGRMRLGLQKLRSYMALDGALDAAGGFGNGETGTGRSDQPL